MNVQNKRISDSLNLMLFWIVASDDQVDDAEILFLSQYVGSELADSSKVRQMIKRVREADEDDFLEAVNTLRSLSREAKVSAMTLAIGVAIADNRLAISENMILRFLADSLLKSQSEFAELYNELTGTTLPEVGDPSSKKWWDSKSSRSSKSDEKAQDKNQNENTNRNRRSSDSLTRAEALKVLGLDDGASLADIKKAYRKLTSLHHPDRFHVLGEEAVRAANIIYRKIVEAYEVLKA